MLGLHAIEPANNAPEHFAYAPLCIICRCVYARRLLRRMLQYVYALHRLPTLGGHVMIMLVASRKAFRHWFTRSASVYVQMHWLTQRRRWDGNGLQVVSCMHQMPLEDSGALPTCLFTAQQDIAVVYVACEENGLLRELNPGLLAP